jgi:FdhE protein
MDSRTIESLRSLEQGKGEFSGLARVYRELLQIQLEAKSKATVVRPNLGETQVQDRLRRGIPLVPFEDFHPDWNQVHAVWEKIVAWAAADSEVSRKMYEDLGDMASNSGLLREAAELWYRGLSMKILPIAHSADIELLTSVVGATLKPFLSAYSESLYSEIDQELWRRKYCPVCGGKPDFSSLKEGGARWLFCSRCDEEWIFSRMECPYCGTRNQESLAYFASEGQPSLYRLYVCEECHTYIKGIDLRVSSAEVLLPLERVCTLDLDRHGREKGYEAGWTVRKVHEASGHGPAVEERERRAN